MTDLPKPDIRALAALSRIAVDEREVPQLEEELSGILEFVREVQQVAVADPHDADGGLHNVMRQDADPYQTGQFTEALLDAAPAAMDGYVEVQQVLAHTKKNKA